MKHITQVKWVVFAKISYGNEVLLTSCGSEEEAQKFADKLQCGYEICHVVIG